MRVVNTELLTPIHFVHETRIYALSHIHVHAKQGSIFPRKRGWPGGNEVGQAPYFALSKENCCYGNGFRINSLCLKIQIKQPRLLCQWNEIL